MNLTGTPGQANHRRTVRTAINKVEGTSLAAVNELPKSVAIEPARDAEVPTLVHRIRANYAERDECKPTKIQPI
jgi:hypothetical protein